MLCLEKRWEKSNWIWLVWLAASLALTARAFLWQIQYFKHPGPEFYRLLLLLLPVSALAVALYCRLRRARLWRYEPILLASALAVAFFAYEPLAALVASLMLVSGYAAGRRILRWLGLSIEDPAGDIAVSSAAGLGALAYALFWLGLARLYYPAIFALVLTAPGLLYCREAAALGASLERLWRRWTSDEELSRPLGGVLAAYGALSAAMTAMVSLAPSVVFDALKMHLTLAASFARQHSLAPLPLLDYSYFPQGAEVLMAAAHSLAGQAGAQMAAPLWFALALLLLVSIIRRASASRLSALAGVAAAVSMPFLHWSGSVAKNDMLLALYQLAALDAYLRWRASGRFAWIWLGAFLLGASFGVKHVALLGGLGLGALYVHAAWTGRRRRAAVAVAGLIFGLFGLCWHARAWRLTGNPVYPERLSRSVDLKIQTARGTLDVPVSRKLTRVWRLLYNGKLFFESPLENPMGTALLLAWPAWLLVRRRESSAAERACLAFCGISLVYWIYHIPALRYALAPLALVVALTVSRLAAFGYAQGSWWRPAVTATLAYVLLFGACGTAILEINAPQIRYFARQLDKAGYLREALRTYRSIEFLRRQARPGERIYGVSHCSYAYAPNPAEMQCYMNRNEVYTPEDAENVRQQFLLGEFRYLIVPRGPAGEVMLGATGPLLEPAPAYRDPYYAVYRAPLSTLSASHSQQSLQR